MERREGNVEENSAQEDQAQESEAPEESWEVSGDEEGFPEEPAFQDPFEAPAEYEEHDQEPRPEGGLDTRTVLLIGGLALALAVVCIVSVALFLRSQSEPEPTLIPTLGIAPTGTIAASPVEPTPPLTDPIWSGIEATGRMIVGTSADYPPFEYYTDNFVLDGFDIALIREIGERLGVEIVIKDMAFDGLGEALQVGQIDAAIAALSITPQRSQRADFSNIYFVTEDAVLTAGEPSKIVSSAQDLAGSRIGVQRFSVYQEWAETELVATGLVGASDLHLYSEIDRAVSDLGSDRLDYVVLDLPPAEAAVSTGGFSIAGEGLNRQRFAIAMPKGAFNLRARINEALGQMQGEGRVQKLAEEYLGLDEENVIPIPTPDPSQPTATPAATAAPPGCVDGMQWVAHLTYDDQDMKNPPLLEPGEPFIKSWRVRNSGSCPWDASYALVYLTGNDPAARMGGKPVFVDRMVNPGAVYDFGVELVAPLIPGIYQAFWTMRDGDGQLFGDKLGVGIEVLAPATATPAVTQTPSPNIQFTVDRTRIKQGECATFAWSVENVQAVYFYADGEDWRENGVAGQGTQTECPASTTTYKLRVIYSDGTVEIKSITVFVEPAPPGAPAISQFSAYPERVDLGRCVQITWDVRGEVTNVRLTRDGVVLWEPAPVRGSIQDCPPGAGTAGYALEAEGPGGTSRAQRNVAVVAPSPTPTAGPNTPTPVPPTATQTLAPNTPSPTPPEPTPIPPVISAFLVAPEQVQAGQCVQVSYRVAGDVDLVQILKNGVIVLDNGPTEASGQDCRLTEPGNVTYRLEASNNAGQKDTREQIIIVSEAPAPTPTPTSEAPASTSTPAATETPPPLATETPPPPSASPTPEPTFTTGPSDPLLGTSWQVTGYFDGTGLVPVLDGTTLTAMFVDIGVGGSAGCNQYSGRYTVNGNNLAIGPLAVSQSVCGEPTGIMEQQTAFVNALESASSFELEDIQLTVLDASGETMITAIQQPR
jgi:polar amino acid transport system substrate-binding protein